MNSDQKEYLEVLGYPPEKWGPSKKKSSPKATTKTKAVPASAPSLNLNWKDLEETALACVSCKLCKTRSTVVFGSGNTQAKIMFVGEGPGRDEDLSGLPFVGRAGQLLSKMIEAMGIVREKDVYIANVVKCRPPENRNPEPDEIEACAPYLRRQIELVNPSVIVALGTFAAQTVLQTDTPIGELRGRFHPHPTQIRKDKTPILVMPTYHPAFCLRNPNMKKPVWEDLQIVMKELGLKILKDTL